MQRLNEGKVTLVGVVVALALSVFGCATEPSGPTSGPGDVRFEGGDGLGCDGRVIITGAEDDRACVDAEYSWLRAKYPEHRVIGQGPTQCEGHAADRIRIRTSSGEELEVYFDVSELFGKGFGRSPPPLSYAIRFSRSRTRNIASRRPAIV